jgi:hypothetical protein
VDWAGLLLRLSPDAPATQALEILGPAGHPELLEASEPQALTRGLLDNGLLETLNRFGFTPTLPGRGFDPSAFRAFLLLRRGDADLTLVFGGNGAASDPAGRGRRLVLALLRLPVPVDPTQDPAGGWSPKRLRLLREALQALAPFALRGLEQDRYGNTFAWSGAHARLQDVRVWYRPERDELRLVLRWRPR